MDDKYKKMTLKELQEKCRQLGLRHTSFRPEVLAARLENREEELRQEQEEAATAAPTLNWLAQWESKDESLFATECDDEIQCVYARINTTGTKVVPSRLMEPSASDAAPQPAAEPADSTNGAASVTSDDLLNEAVDSTDALSPKTKATKLARAQRFGLPLSGDALKAKRAERFGLNASLGGGSKEGGTAVNPEVLRKRAERFELPIKSDTDKPTGDAALPASIEKLAAHVKRFGVSTDTAETAAPSGSHHYFLRKRHYSVQIGTERYEQCQTKEFYVNKLLDLQTNPDVMMENEADVRAALETNEVPPMDMFEETKEPDDVKPDPSMSRASSFYSLPEYVIDDDGELHSPPVKRFDDRHHRRRSKSLSSPKPTDKLAVMDKMESKSEGKEEDKDEGDDGGDQPGTSSSSR